MATKSANHYARIEPEVKKLLNVYLESLKTFQMQNLVKLILTKMCVTY